jgi:hypothetical protein
MSFFENRCFGWHSPSVFARLAVVKKAPRPLARVKCEDCGHEYLLAFSCKRRHFCPSCHQKRVVVVIENMMNWRHSGFSVYCGKAIWPHNQEGLENLIGRVSFKKFIMLIPYCVLSALDL